MQLRKVISFSLIPTLYVLFVLLLEFIEDGLAQNPDPLFELPVQLVGFPVIVLSVRLSQFAKKLAYSLNPNTYRSRSRRDVALSQNLAYDVALAHKEILREFGPQACIMEEPCRQHAARPGRIGTTHAAWQDMLRYYKAQSSAGGIKQWYLLSMYIGDAVRDVPLCKHLAKRLPCPGLGPLPAPLPR